ncbi:divisome protein SepX/GlpR [Spirillospora sp. CA-294931]|uniref:divisome protein SepX/GlpR n=1 Tax=Spirillospora sp. CA-294931 TaxID=3240042 RepID=UPI003D8EA6D8
MSSAVLYLAIVAVWAVVLVPMWLRRDSEASGITRLLAKRPNDELDEEPEQEPEVDLDLETEPEPAPRRRHTGRAAVIARRRRRTSGLTALFLASTIVIATGLAPWWITLPPFALLAGHLALLRVAVGMDAARQEEERAAAEAAAAQAPEPTPAAPQAEIIELVTPEEVFDQYADDRRAVGE